MALDALFDEVAAGVSFVRLPSPAVLITNWVHLCSCDFASFCPLHGSKICYP